MMSPAETRELGEAWRAGLGGRDPRDRRVAMNRALGIPDNATTLIFQRAMAQFAGDGWLVSALAELEYRKMLLAEHGNDVPDDDVSRWLREQRDLEVEGSAEWWAVDRLRRRYLLRFVAVKAPGDEPAPS